MKAFSHSIPAFLKSSVQKIQDTREHWNAALQESLQELNDPKYEKTGQAVAFIFIGFFLLQIRLVIGVFLLLLSTLLFRGALENVNYLSFGLLFLLLSFVCLVSPFIGSAFKLWREWFLTIQLKSFTLKLLLQVVFFCMVLHTACHIGRMVWDFFVKGIGE